MKNESIAIGVRLLVDECTPGEPWGLLSPYTPGRVALERAMREGDEVIVAYEPNASVHAWTDRTSSVRGRVLAVNDEAVQVELGGSIACAVSLPGFALREVRVLPRNAA